MSFTVLFYLAVILIAGLVLGRAVKLIKLPNVTGYLLAGLLLGPSMLGVLPKNFVLELDLVSEIALALIALTIGSEFKFSYLKRVGITPVIIALFEGLTAMLVVTVALLAFGVGIEIALLMGAIASATAPAATVMVIKQYGAKGPVTETLLSVVALDDAVALIAFGFSMAAVNTMLHPGETSLVISILRPFGEILGSMALGILLGVLFKIPMRFFKKKSNRLIAVLGFVFLGAALADMLGLSSLLLCMSMGAAIINVCGSDALDVFQTVDSITPPIFLMFFVASGAELDVSVLPTVGLIGAVYIITRVIGKVGGASLGATVMKCPPAVKKYIGFTLVPQAGVAIGLSLVASQALPEQGATIRAVVLCATLIYELVGPLVTKTALRKAGEITA